MQVRAANKAKELQPEVVGSVGVGLGPPGVSTGVFFSVSLNKINKIKQFIELNKEILLFLQYTCA